MAVVLLKALGRVSQGLFNVGERRRNHHELLRGAAVWAVKAVFLRRGMRKGGGEDGSAARSQSMPTMNMDGHPSIYFKHITPLSEREKKEKERKERKDI